MADSLHRYLFDELPVRCLIVRLENSWQESFAHCSYEPHWRNLLGRAAAANQLLAASLKFEGRITLQISGGDSLDMLVVQTADSLQWRGMINGKPGTTGETAEATSLLKDCQIVVTGESTQNQERYQGIVETVGSSLKESLEHYLQKSEQLPSRLWLAADGDAAVGLLLQRLPDSQRPEENYDEDGWNRIQHLADTLTDKEMLSVDPETIVHRLFHQEALRHLDSRKPEFRCSCSRERVATMIQGLGEADATALIEERGTIEVTCEFCNRQYAFDAIDTSTLFTAGTAVPAPEKPQ